MTVKFGEGERGELIVLVNPFGSYQNFYQPTYMLLGEWNIFFEMHFYGRKREV